MDVIIVCHTEFGFVHGREVIFEENATIGVENGVSNLIKITDKYGAKVTFAVMPEIVKCFPKNIKHEIGLHIHPGWIEQKYKGFRWYVGDSYLIEQFKSPINSTVLRDYTYKEQLEMIKIGKDCLQDNLGIEPKVFVAGRWSENCDTHKALVNIGLTHDCSPPASQKAEHFDWSKLPRICMPYHPSEQDYQENGSLPLLIIPISQMLKAGNVNPEAVPIVGLSWLKACFLEYYKQNLSLFHICLHSPIMTDPYFISALDEFLKFISMHKNINFRFTSEVKEYNEINPKTNILPYLFRVNRTIMKTGLRSMKSRIFGGGMK